MSIIREARDGDTLSHDERKLTMQPDAAATLAPDWDAFGMMEINAEEPCNQPCNELNQMIKIKVQTRGSNTNERCAYFFCLVGAVQRGAWQRQTEAFG